MTLVIDSKLMAYNCLHAHKPVVNLFEDIANMAKRIERVKNDSITSIILVYDHGKSDYRLSFWPLYKGTRSYGTVPDTFALTYLEIIPMLARALGLNNVIVRGVEADDLVALVSAKIKGNIVICTSDMDWLQLVFRHDNVEMFNIKKWELLDRSRATEVSGCISEEQFLVKKAIVSDLGDNIRGITGIGPVKFSHFAKEAFALPDSTLKESFLSLCKRNNTATHSSYGYHGVNSCEELYDFNMRLGRLMVDSSHLSVEQKVALNASYVSYRAGTDFNEQEALTISEQYGEGHVGPFGHAYSLSPIALQYFEEVYHRSKRKT